MKQKISLDSNTILYGKSYSGKTKKFLLPSINDYIAKRESFFVIDTKEEYIKSYFERLSNYKYNILILDLKDFKHTIGWNPLLEPYKAYKNGNIKYAIEQLQNLSSELFQDINLSKDYLKEEIKQYFIALAILLFRSASEEEINLSSIYALSTIGAKSIQQTTYLGKILSVMDVMDPVYMMGSNLIYSTKNLKDEMLSVFNQKLVKYLRYPDLANVLKDSTFNFTDLMTHPTALFIKAIDTDSSENYLIPMFIRQLLDVALRKNKEHRFHLIIDDLDFLPKINCLSLLLALSHNYNYSVSLSVRNSDFISKLYGNDYKNIISNMNVVYNLDYDDVIVKVENNEKVSLPKADYEDFNSDMKEYDYPVLESSEAKIFNLEEELSQRIDEKK